MKKIYLSSLLMIPTLLADNGTARCEELLRAGRPAEALQALPEQAVGDDVLFWKGRTLLAMGRMAEAALAFKDVNQESTYGEHAAKGLIYCAWQESHINFVETVAPLCASPNPKISSLALAALAEFQLKFTQAGDTTSLDELNSRAKSDPTIASICRHLNLEAMRRNKQYAEAIALAKRVIDDNNEPVVNRHRMRLSLAEIYYDQATHENPEETDTEADDEEPVSAEGKGEETLLQFISTTPDSPLLKAAFQHLHEHQAFDTSQYARRAISEWTADAMNEDRALLAFQVEQQQALKGNPIGPRTSATIANHVLFAFPDEALTQDIVMEHVRHLLSLEQLDEALKYLERIPQSSPRRIFYEARCTRQDAAKALELYLQCAEAADDSLRAAALSNALICATEAGRTDVVEKIMSQAVLPGTRRMLLLTHAALVREENPELCRKELEELLSLTPVPAPQNIHAELDLAELDIEKAPELARQRLENLPQELLSHATDEQILRYYGLKIKLDDSADNTGTRSIDTLKSALQSTLSPVNRTILTRHLTTRLVTQEKYKEALELLEKLIDTLSPGNERATVILQAAKAAEVMKTQEGMEKALKLLTQCVEEESDFRNTARVLKCALQVWMNESEKAEPALNSLLSTREKLSPVELAMAYIALSDSYSMRGNPEGHAKAMEISGQLMEIPGLDRTWQVRARLQHGAMCARSQNRQKCIATYLEVLDIFEGAQDSMSPSDWIVLYYAASSAVHQYCELHEYEAAARLAERMSTWPGADVNAPVQSKRQGQWAKRIRKEHNLLQTNSYQRKSHHIPR